MKGKIRLIGILLLTVILAATLAACGGKKDDNPKAPTQSDWSAVGIAGGFSAEVKGNLVTNLAVDGEIQMKWTDSDETSLDNTIAWLKSKGFSSYGGATATKESLQDGALLSYTAEKSVSAVRQSAKTMSFAAAASAKNAVVAETLYVARDVSLMGMSYKAGELYLSVAPDNSGSTPAPGPSTEWPAQTIASVIGDGVPAFMGSSTSIDSSSNTIGVNLVTIFVYGTTQADANSYGAALTSAGFSFSEEDEKYTKTVTNGTVMISLSYDDGTLIVQMMLNKTGGTGGSESGWPTATLNAKFAGANIPSFAGASSFDVTDQTVIAAYPVILITAYGADNAKVSAYESSLIAAGFMAVGGDFKKNIGDNTVTVSVNLVENNALIMVSSVPKTDEEPITPAYTLPTNVKITFTYSIYTYTSIKIGEDYYCMQSAYGTTEEFYYKKTATGWDSYTKGNMDSEWTKKSKSYTKKSIVESNIFSFIVEDIDVEGMTAGETMVIAGITTTKYTSTSSSSGYEVTEYVYKDLQSGLVLKSGYIVSGADTSKLVTSFDTTVTGFGDISLP